MTRLLLCLSIVVLACAVPSPQSPVTGAEMRKPRIHMVTSAVTSSAGIDVTITAASVHIRTVDGLPTGEYAFLGDVLVISEFRADGWGVIAEPSKWQGLTIWRGCTSLPAGRGCEAR